MQVLYNNNNVFESINMERKRVFFATLTGFLGEYGDVVPSLSRAGLLVHRERNLPHVAVGAAVDAGIPSFREQEEPGLLYFQYAEVVVSTADAQHGISHLSRPGVHDGANVDVRHYLDAWWW